MNLAVWICLLALGLATGIVAAVVRQGRRTSRASLPPEVLARRRALRERLQGIIARVPRKRSLYSPEIPNHPQALAIEAKLLSGNMDEAWDLAESLLLESSWDARAHLLLARVSILRGELQAASHEIARARLLGARGAMLDYLEGRARYLHLQHRLGSGHEHAETLLTPLDTLILQFQRSGKPRAELAPTDHAATPLGLDKADVIALVSDHFSAYYTCLDKLASAVEREPAFSDALYHTARMALQVGFLDEGLALMIEIAPLMESSPERHFYERDMAHLYREGMRRHATGFMGIPRISYLPGIHAGKRSSGPKVLN